MAEAVVYILQYDSPDGFEFTETQKYYSSDTDIIEEQQTYTLNSEYTQYTVYPGQNPLPRQKGATTANREDFSDSPDNAPTILDNYRYGYGRRTSAPPDTYDDTFGNLSKDHGLLIRQIDWGTEGTFSARTKNYSDTGTIRQDDFSSSCSNLIIQGLYESSYTSIEQFAFLLSARPTPYSIKNPVNTDVFIRLANHTSYPLASGTINLCLDRLPQTGLDIQPFYLGYGGIDVTWTNIADFDYGAKVLVDWVVYDTAVPPNKITFSYWFRTVEDLTGPRILNQVPADDTTGVVINSSISFDIVDYEAGVDMTTMELYINNKLISNSDSGLNISMITDGYRVLYTPSTSFLYGDTIPVVVKITDSSEDENESFFVWSFSTEGSIEPVLTNMQPSPCSTGVERFGNISFEVVDGGHGLSSSSIIMGINGVTRDNTLLIPIIRRFD